MVASNSRKKLRQRQLDQARRDERQKKTEDAVFGEFENEVEPDVPADEAQTQGISDARSGKAKGAEAAAEDGQKNLKAASAKPKKQDGKAKVEPGKKRSESKPAASESRKAPRFIVFVGKLPFSATNETIKRHFSKIEPTSIRHATEKTSGKSRGFAFLEFDRFERMNDCLRLYHHSMFDDGLGGEPRRINIELTAGGGGGKSNERKERIRAKNAKLTVERTRRAKASKVKGKGKGDDGAGDAQSGGPKMANMAEGNSSIHPSRLSRFSG